MAKIDQDRIILAEAMGGPIWEAYIKPVEHPECIELPDPFTNANDDYVVLEWMRSDLNTWKYQYSKELMKTNSEIGSYIVGDYARAALEVIYVQNT